MANVVFSKNEFEKHIKLTPEVVEKINLFGISAELSGNALGLEILPNRPDLIPLQGFTRGMRAYLGKETGLRKYKIGKPEKNYKVSISPSVKFIRPFTACAIIKGMKFNNEKIKEIIDVQEKLHSTIGRDRKKVAIGIYPLEKIKLPIRYEARKPGSIRFIPLEMSQELSGLQILERHPAGRKYSHLIDELEKYPIFIDANEKILSMPPIINSNETGKITINTKDIFVECSGFDLTVLKQVLNIIVTAMIDMGGNCYSLVLDYGKDKVITPDLSPEKLRISLVNINKILGLNLKEKNLKMLLSKMGYDYKNGYVYIPAWRTDVLHEVDIAEDILIAYGYNNLIPQIPKIATDAEESIYYKVRSRIADILIGLQFLETLSLHLIKKDESNIIGEQKIELENSKTDYKYLRSNLLTPCLRNLAENKDNEYPQRVFEIGVVFSKDKTNKSELGIAESDNLIIAISPGNFTGIKQILNYLFELLGIGYNLIEIEKEGLIEGRRASVLLDNEEIGYLGELHPETLRAWNLKMPVSVLEISLRKIYSILTR